MTNTCRFKLLVGTWKFGNMCPQPSTFWWTARMWFDGGFVLNYMQISLTYHYLESNELVAYMETHQ